MKRGKEGSSIAGVSIEIMMGDITRCSRAEKGKKRQTKKRRETAMVQKTRKSGTGDRKTKRGSAGGKKTKKRSVKGKKTKRGSAMGRRTGILVVVSIFVVVDILVCLLESFRFG